MRLQFDEFFDIFFSTLQKKGEIMVNYREITYRHFDFWSFSKFRNLHVSLLWFRSDGNPKEKA